MYINLYNFNIRHAYTLEELTKMTDALYELQMHSDKTKSKKAIHDFTFLKTMTDAIRKEEESFYADIQDMEKSGKLNHVEFKISKGEVEVEEDVKVTKYGIEPLEQWFIVELKTDPAKFVESRKTTSISPQNALQQAEVFLTQQGYKTKDAAYTGEVRILSEDRKKVFLTTIIQP